MSFRNRGRQSRVESRELRAKRALARARSSRRGVLLLVVLSLLVLFMLIGTAFLMSSNQYKRSSAASAKLFRVGNFPTKLLDRALMQVLCDTGNRNSAIRYHSLLRDMYGAEGFEAVIYSPIDTDLDPSFAAGNPGSQVTRFATPTNGSPPAATRPLGPTQGQFVDIYVREHAFRRDDRLILGSEPLPIAPDARNIIKLEPSVLGLPEMYNMPLTKGYFNGCLLTVTSGAARGQSTRILDYEYVGDVLSPSQTAGTAPAPYPLKRNTRIFRFRVMTFPNASGQPLAARRQYPATDPRFSSNTARELEIADLAGATIVVNGRPFNGTGVGFNEVARAGEPRLNALETVGVHSDSTKWLYPEVALTPNAAFFFASDPVNSNNDLLGARYRIPDTANPGQFLYPPLNPTNTSVVATTPVNLRPERWKYQRFTGPGDADESYDAPDFQNMFLASQTVSPRAKGRYVQGSATSPTTLEVDSPSVDFSQFLRLDLEDLPIPSFHRPDLINFWFHRLATQNSAPISDDSVSSVLAPYGANGIRDDFDDPNAVDLEVRDQIVAIKRKISLRPLREDHPNFDGSNPASRPLDLDGVNNLVRNGNITVPFWEAVGPWDVDNDNDGVPDSVWVDLGDPVAQAEDGTLYKPLYALLIVDMDGRLNVNAHGLVEHVKRDVSNPNIPPQLDGTFAFSSIGNLAHDVNLTIAGIPALNTSNYLPAGIGYGPAEISLRPVFSPQMPGNATLAQRVGNPAFDDYARVLSGRPATDATLGNQSSVWGRHGSVNIRQDIPSVNWLNNTTAAAQRDLVRPGIPFDITSLATQQATLDRLTPFNFVGYPLWLSNYYGTAPNPTIAGTGPTATAFSTPPDLAGRYALGLDYVGQPVVEPKTDALFYGERSLVHDTPYELNLADSSRRELPDSGMAAAIKAAPQLAANDDAPFATAELERIVRAHDADAGVLPDRLWNLVDAFDPLKLVQNQDVLVEQRTVQMFGSGPNNAQRLAAAQQIASENRRLVTTDSYDLPVLGTSLPGYVSQFGPDGQPGRAGVDDDNLNGVDDLAELNATISDDLRNIVGKSRAQCTILDVLRYRVWCEMRKQVMRENGWTEPDMVGTGISPANYTTFLTNVTNRTDALMNGEPFTDANGNGVRDPGEAFVNTNGNENSNGDPVYDPPLPQQILAPEILAGKKTNLNRPFGDGRDNGDGIDNDGDGFVDETWEIGAANDPRNSNGIDDNGDGRIDERTEGGDPFLNGIVDDPVEAGEPFLDVNGNGKWDVGEKWIDVNADGIFNPPLDRLWTELTDLTNGPLHEVISFDYTNGHGEPLHGEAWTGLSAGGVRNLNSQGRQLFARHLYCLMMLLMDENYLEMPDMPALEGNNLNLERLLMQIAADDGGSPFAPTQQHMLEARRKVTAQKVAQWAINVVDQRDADSIMTAFEYDENPFDGWGCIGSKDSSIPANRVNIPLDGDVATDENLGQIIDWQNLNPTHNDPSPTPPTPPHSLRKPIKLVTDLPIPLHRTRVVVWGAERPELLITETLAFHDRRCTDEPINGSIVTFDPNKPPHERDYDLDQRLKPRGSLFVEFYNPWTADGNRPTEFYGNVPGSGVADRGVMLNKLTDERDPVSNKQSPVWRMSVLRDPLNGRLPVFRNPASGKLDSGVLDMSTFGTPQAVDRDSVSADFLTIDPDGYGINMDDAAERHVYFTTGRDYTTGLGSDANRANDDNPLSELTTPGEWAMTGTPVPVINQLSVRVPPLPQPKQELIAGTTHIVQQAKRYFLARNERMQSATPNDVDMTIAPILPGRYAVVGSSGLQLRGLGATTSRADDGQVAERFVTPLSRDAAQPEDGGGDKWLFGPGTAGRLPETRRIELWPNQQGRPDVNQVLVSENGGHEFVRIDNATVINVTDPDKDGDPRTMPVAQQLIDPAVAIPIEDLNISEPVEGYPSVTYRRMYEKNTPMSAVGPEPAPPKFELRVTDEGDLEFYDPFGSSPGVPAYYDRPLDTEFELIRNGTTQNYRSVHLQRLANPLLPWNPLPLDAAGKPNPLHRPWLPVNPYRTIDSQSVDITAFNGASTLERTNLPVPMTFGQDLSTDKLQANILAPISAQQFKNAPDHEIWAILILLNVKKAQGEIAMGVPGTPQELRAVSDADVEQLLNALEEIEPTTRGELTSMFTENTPVGVDPKFPNGIQDGWHWHMYRRVLPDDQLPGITPNTYRQWMHFKSLERGFHASSYFKYPKPGAFYSSNPATLEGWAPDSSVVPRTLWKQERANARLFLQGATGIVDASDLKNVTSWRVLSGKTPADPVEAQKEAERTPDSEVSRNQDVWSELAASMAPGPQPTAVFDYVMEQTLGFANRSYTPDLERMDGEIRGAILKNTARPGAPEVATDSDQRPADHYPANPRLTYGATPNKEIWNSQREAAKLATAPNPPTPQPSLLQAVATSGPASLETQLVNEFFERRRQLTSSTFPWLSWNDRPLASAEEIMNVSASPSSIMLRDYSIPNFFTANAYDGERTTGTPPALKTVGQQVAGQKAPFGHLLNFFASSLAPAVPIIVPMLPNEPTGAPHFQRIMEYVEVPSRYVGTETVLSAEVFNDALGVTDTYGTEILNPGDPRNGFRPPFNLVSNERDPGRVNLNTVTGRRGGVNPATGAHAAWSEVYDGIMHRYRDGNLMNPLATGSVLQLSHFGPAWRDVALSRRGYAQYNADNALTYTDTDPSPVETVAFKPETYSMGLSRDFPSVFSNPFRSSDAGDLVPLPNMLRPGAEATLMRGHHWHRVFDPAIIANPFAATLPTHPRIAWGLSGVDDDANGIVDDVREAGFGDALNPNLDGDPLKVDHPTKALQGGGIPLFSEQVPEPSIDAERNSGMMYQPMTRLGNLVTTRSNVYAIWITVGYFEVEKAPDWSLPATRQRFGGTTNDTDAATIRARALYDRVYPEGYMLGEELGTDTGSTERARAFYIIDRTEPVGFKPGEDLNVENMIRVRRRIE